MKYLSTTSHWSRILASLIANRPGRKVAIKGRVGRAINIFVEVRPSVTGWNEFIETGGVNGGPAF